MGYKQKKGFYFKAWLNDGFYIVLHFFKIMLYLICIERLMAAGKYGRYIILIHKEYGQ
jgi:hypothetical protein